MLVVDASVAVRWFIRDERTDEALRYTHEGYTLLAPLLLLIEFANAMWKLIGAKVIDRVFAQDALRDVADFFDELVADAELLPQALLIADDLRHPVYDCLYLALARQRGVRLPTTVFCQNSNRLHPSGTPRR